MTVSWSFEEFCHDKSKFLPLVGGGSPLKIDPTLGLQSPLFVFFINDSSPYLEFIDLISQVPHSDADMLVKTQLKPQEHLMLPSMNVKPQRNFQTWYIARHLEGLKEKQKESPGRKTGGPIWIRQFITVRDWEKTKQIRNLLAVSVHFQRNARVYHQHDDGGEVNRNRRTGGGTGHSAVCKKRSTQERLPFFFFYSWNLFFLPNLFSFVTCTATVSEPLSASGSRCDTLLMYRMTTQVGW